MWEGCGRDVGVTQTRAWKSRAARLPKPRTKIVTQLKKIALGIGSIASDEGRGGGGARLLTEEAVLGQVTPVIMLSGCLLS